MAMLLLLSVLVSFVSHHGTSANSGCIISKGGLDKFYLSSREPLQDGLEHYLTELPPLYLSGRLLQVTIIGVPTVENPELTLVPSWGLRISVCKVLRVRYLTCVSSPVPAITWRGSCTAGSGTTVVTCAALPCKRGRLLGVVHNVKVVATHVMSSVKVTVSINVCGKIRLRGGPHRLSIDDCSTDFGDMEAEDSEEIELPRAALIELLGGPICQANIEMFTKLNYLNLFDFSVFPRSVGCTYERLPPSITESAIEFPFFASCEEAPESLPPLPSCSLPTPGVLDATIMIYASSEDTTSFLASIQRAKGFDKEMTLDSLSTTTITEHFPEINSPRGYPAVVRITCTEVNAVINPIGIHLDFILRVSVGYKEPEFVPLLNLVLTGKLVVHATTNCQTKLILFSVSISSEFQIKASCKTESCTIENDVVESIFPLKRWSEEVFSDGLKGKFYLFLPIHYSCDVCNSIIYLEGCAYFSCVPHFAW